MGTVAGAPNGASGFHKEEWFIEEYKQRSDEISKHLDREQQLLNNALLAVGGVTAFVGAIHAYWGSWLCPFGLFLGFFFVAMAAHHLRYDLFIAYNAEYIEERVRTPALEHNALPSDDTLTWERFVSARRASGTKGRVLHVVLFLSRIAPLVLASGGFIAWAVWWAFWKEMPQGELAWISVALGVLALCGWIGFVLVGFAVDRQADKTRKAAEPADARAAASRMTWKRLRSFCKAKNLAIGDVVDNAINEYIEKMEQKK